MTTPQPLHTSPPAEADVPALETEAILNRIGDS